MTIAQVLIRDATRAFDRYFDYRIPEDLQAQIQVGSWVELPFGRANRSREAIVIELAEGDPETVAKLKMISRIISGSMLLPDQIELLEEMRRRYFCSRAQALKTILPAPLWGTKAKTALWVELTEREAALELLETDSLRSVKQQRVLEILLDEDRLELSELMTVAAVSRSVLSGLEKKELIQLKREKTARKALELPVSVEPRVETLNKEQDLAYQQIKAALQTGIAKEFLLHGVTGSGKTEVYLSLAEACLAMGRSVLVLVPEIALTPLMLSRIVQRFGSEAALMHSRLTLTERYEQWMQVLRGEKHLVVGARSAIFAPVHHLGLIIIDEEQESSYKSDHSPRYTAHDIARIRSRQSGAVLLLGSATPSIESYVRTLQGRSQLLTLAHRAVAATLPNVHLIDLRAEKERGMSDWISEPLLQALSACFARGEQAMLFLNRRGKARFVLCEACGSRLDCPNCEISLTEHVHSRSSSSQLLCHYCGHLERKPERCPHCGSESLRSVGMGTQELEASFKRLFPEVPVLRMDQDSTAKRAGHEEILSAFRRQEASCLIGTQMIAKGHDFPQVTVVGILCADQLLAMSDYKAEERAFQLMTQCAGRAGRHELPGEVYIQAYDIHNKSLLAAARQDYATFFEHEWKFRQRFHFPPACFLGLIVVQASQEAPAAQWAQILYRRFRKTIQQKPELASRLQIFEPAPAPLARLNRIWRYRLILKAQEAPLLYQLFQQIADLKLPPEVKISLDINPNVLL